MYDNSQIQVIQKTKCDCRSQRCPRTKKKPFARRLRVKQLTSGQLRTSQNDLQNLNLQFRSPDGSSPHNCDSQEDVLPLPRVIFHLNALRRHCLSPTAQACEALTPVDTDPYRASTIKRMIALFRFTVNIF
jgi:hypothetical protein